ncbi:hypothetical protein ACWIDS_16240 [Dietzia maris]
MRDPDTIVIAPTMRIASEAGWLGYTARHVITPQASVRLRGRTIRHVHVVGFDADCPGLARIMVEIAAVTIGQDDPRISYH